MNPKELIQKWVEAFNEANVEVLSNMYSDDAINHQVANEPVMGRQAITKMFREGFSMATMTCIPENIFQDKDWGILEWKDPQGLRGCGFFQFKNDKIIFQRGYWDKLSFHKLHGIPLQVLE